MSELRIWGGQRLYGTLDIQGAKNGVLPILAAVILGRGTTRIENCPQLSDVSAAVRILEHLGARVEREGTTLTIDTAVLEQYDIPDEMMREMRSSIIFLGAILARLGEAEVSLPGGCELGPRPIDLHLAALRQLGAEISECGGTLHYCAATLRGAEITLAFPSVGATENALLAACAAEGTTTISNAAREPEIVDLAAMLNAMGACIAGAGSSVITVEGKRSLHGCTHRCSADRIAAATYLCAAAAAGGEVCVRGIDYRMLSTVTQALRESGCAVTSEQNAVILRSSGRLHAIRPVRTAPYPGFPTDAQPVLMAALLKSEGATVFVENIFENRYRHVDELARMGARIRVVGRVAVVDGRESLRGAKVKCTDLRGGAALVIAALGAEGESRITALEHIERGYENLAGNLRTLGAEIAYHT
ncbi:MAG: UDP-N-acetylglucosamine 1-carboxyvinyltransferase [Oscillospiraceae bacterium]|nr:UDP-N-acetylglucosamine 1-carboxyvinyltransferase [Oscillospiraceae bacterium]